MDEADLKTESEESEKEELAIDESFSKNPGFYLCLKLTNPVGHWTLFQMIEVNFSEYDGAVSIF